MTQSAVAVRAKSNLLLVPLLLIVGLGMAALPIGGWLQVAWSLLVMSAFVTLATRAARMGITADQDGLVVRNFGATRVLGWSEVAEITAGRSDNVSAGVTTIRIRKVDGSVVVGRGASAYSRAAVEHWRDELTSAQLSGPDISR